jgi:hypothetical protein
MRPVELVAEARRTIRHGVPGDVGQTGEALVVIRGEDDAHVKGGALLPAFS